VEEKKKTWRNKYTNVTLPLETKQHVKQAVIKFTRACANGRISEETSRTLAMWLRLLVECNKQLSDDRIAMLERKIEGLNIEPLDVDGCG
jgi:hypothetical protein